MFVTITKHFATMTKATAQKKCLTAGMETVYSTNERHLVVIPAKARCLDIMQQIEFHVTRADTTTTAMIG